MSLTTVLELRKRIASVIIGAAAVFVLVAIIAHTMSEDLIARIFMTCVLVWIFLTRPLWGDRLETAPRWRMIISFSIDTVALIGSVVSGWYATYYFSEFIMRPANPTQLDIVMGTAALVLIAEATRRISGWPLVILAGIFISYAFLGSNLPMLIRHIGFGADEIISASYMTERGVYGIALKVIVRFVLLFVVLGSFLEISGASKHFVNIARALTWRIRGGLAQVAIVSSALMGSVSGSAVANVVTTGSITIPAMKRENYPGVFAGAVEAAASTGGQIMPPIMGAAAFMMASYLGIPYVEIMVAALTPALLYYLGVAISAYLYAVSNGLGRSSPLRREELAGTLRKIWTFLLPLAVFVWFLVVQRNTPTMSAFFAIIAALASAMLVKENRPSLSRLVNVITKAGESVAYISGPVAIAGIVIAVVSTTGLAIRLSQILVDVSGGNLGVLLVLTGIMSIILGMGLPTVVAYIILSTLVAPVLVSMGIAPIIAHLFIFYFGILSMITPPVAFASYAAAAIAEVNANSTGYLGLKLTLAGFVVPFIFVYNPALTLQYGLTAQFFVSLLIAVVSVIAIAGLAMGYLIKPLRPIERIMLMAAIIVLIKPTYVSYLVGSACLAVVLLSQLWQRGSTPTRVAQ